MKITLTKSLLTGVMTGLISFSAITSYAQVTEDYTTIRHQYDKSAETRTEDLAMLPQTQHVYNWEDNEWVLKASYNSVWNDHNKRDQYYEYSYQDGELTFCSHITYQYNSDDEISRSTIETKYGEYSDWELTSMYEFTYDEVLKDYIVMSEPYEWDYMLEDWMPSSTESGYCDEIKRDDNGRVVTKTVWDSPRKHFKLKEYVYEYYDAEGPASSIYIEGIDDKGNYAPLYYIDDIVWEKSNCQYVNENYNIFFIWDKDKDNKIKSMNINYFDGDGYDHFFAKVENKWDADGRKLYSAILSYDGVNILNAFEYNTISNGGYIYYYISWEDKNNNSVYDKGEEFMTNTSTRTIHEFDAFGNEINDESYEYNLKSGQFDILNYRTTNDIEYLEDGNVKEIVYTHYNYNNDITKKEKRTFSDFIEPNVTAIGNVSNKTSLAVCDGYVSAATGMSYNIYDIQGRLIDSGIVTASKISLDTLPEGIYIVSAGGQNVKIVR